MGFSNYPNQIDTTTELPVTVDLQTPVSAEVVNRHRDAILAVEGELGLIPSGTYGTVRARLDAMDGSIGFLGERSGSLIGVLEEGTTIRANVKEINFIGPATTVTAAAIADRVDVTITASGAGGSTIFQEQETLSVNTNGQTSFTLSQTPQDDTAVELYVNGFKQEHGTDYSLATVAVTYSGSFTLLTTDVVEAWYIAVGGDVITQEQEMVAVTSPGQTSFVLSGIPIDPTAVKMFINGQKQENAVDYTVAVSTVTYLGGLTLATADIVEFWYVISGLSASSSSGGGESLAATLDIGNLTDGYDIIIADGDLIIGQTGVLAIDGGDVGIRGGPATGTGVGGDIAVLGGSSVGASNAGNITVTGGPAGGTGDGGTIGVVGGSGTDGGTVSVTGGAGSADGGNVILTTGTTGAVAGDIRLDVINSGSTTDGYIEFQEDGTTFLQFDAGSGRIHAIDEMILASAGIVIATLDGSTSTTTFVSDIIVDGSQISFAETVTGQIRQAANTTEAGHDLLIAAQSTSIGAGGDLIVRAGVGSDDGYFIVTNAAQDTNILTVDSTPAEVTIAGKLTVTGLIDPTGLVLDEQAAGFGAANVSGNKGIIWVDNSTNPNRLIFTDESGADNIVSGLGAGDETLSQTLALGNITDGYDITVSDGDNFDLAHDGTDFLISFVDTASGAGSDINVTGQNSVDANASGSINLTSGNVVGGSGEGGNASDVTISGGTTDNTGRQSGSVNLRGGAGAGSAADGGNVTLLSGSATGAGEDGIVTIGVQEASSAASLNGKINFLAGASGTTAVLSIYRQTTVSNESIIEFDSAAINPIIRQESIAGAVGDDLTIAAQTSSTTTGGDLILQPGSGSGGDDGLISLDGYIDANDNPISRVADPTNPKDAVNKRTLENASNEATFILSGIYSGASVPGTFDPPYPITTARTISSVTLMRRTAGSSGTTRIDVLKSGVSILDTTTKPEIAFGAGNNARVTVTAFDVGEETLTTTDYIDIELEAVESGSPEGLTVIIRFV